MADNSDAFSAYFGPNPAPAPAAPSAAAPSADDAFSAYFAAPGKVASPKETPALEAAPSGSDGLHAPVTEFLAQAGRAASFGLTDKASAFLTAVEHEANKIVTGESGGPSFSDVYHNALANNRGYGEAYAKAHPVASSLATAAGMGSTFVAGPEGAVPETLLGRTAIGAAKGAGIGALAGFGQSNDRSLGQTLHDTGTGALVGGITGGAVPLAAEAGQYLGNAARAIVAPFTEAGQSALATQAIEKYAGAPVAPNATEIIPGSKPTLAEATGNPGVANLQRTMRDINPNALTARDMDNAAARTNLLHQVTGNPTDIDAAVSARDAAAVPKLNQAMASAGEANPAYVNRTINRILAGPSGQRDVVRNALADVQGKLTVANPIEDRVSRALAPIREQLASDAPMSEARQQALSEAQRLLISAQRGNTSEADLVSGLNKLAKTQKVVGPIDNALSVIREGDTKFQTDPAQLYGIRQAITDKLSPLASGTGSDARLAARQLGVVKRGLDSAIEKAAPGYKDYLQTYSEMSKPIDQMKFLQGLNLTDAQGNVTLQKVQTALKNINKLQAAKGVNPAKSLTQDQIGALTALRDDLLRRQNNALGHSLGSNTVQNVASQNLLQGLLPGKVGAFAGKINPEIAGATIGTGLGYTIGHPEMGAAVGAGAGRVLDKILESKNRAVQAKIEQLLLNPSSFSPSPGFRGQNLVNNPLVNQYLPYALPGTVVNRLLAPSGPAVTPAVH